MATELTSRAAIDRDGFSRILQAIPRDQVDQLRASIDHAIAQQTADSKRSGKRPRPGLRNLTERAPAVAALVQSATVRQIARDLLGVGAFAVRTLYFDKLPGANWNMRWHQDVAIAVRGRANVAGFGPWSVKDGVTHVEPPVEVVQQMLALRVHLDDCDESNGALRVIAGSHAQGRLRRDAAMQFVESHEAVTCSCNAGDILAMKPLLLHASLPAISPNHRRVIHIEFARVELPDPIDWYERL